ncbi:MAG: SGNH/GDSL hydrolase family protein [Candidatus Aenigmatarchaeota archaeon]
MKKSTLIYITYLISLVILTVFLSIKIISNKHEFKVIGYHSRVISLNFSGCPCKEIGVGFPACPSLFQKKSENPLLHSELRPNYTQIYDGTWVCESPTTIKINSYGFRDYEYSLEKPSNTIRIVAVGDSHTFGLGVELEDTYPKVLEKRLNERNDKKKYEVLNFGVPAYDLNEKIEVLKSKALNFSPDIIIFQYTGDDILFNMELQEKIRKMEGELTQKLRRELNLEEKTLLQRTIREESLKKIDGQKQQELIERGFERLASILPSNIKLIILAIHTPELQMAIFPKIVEKNHWYIIDTGILYSQYSKKDLELDLKDNHLNPFGYRLISEKIYNLLVEENIL